MSNYRIKDLAQIINVLKQVFHEIDWAESGDSSRRDAESIIYNLMLELGDNLFNGDSE